MSDLILSASSIQTWLDCGYKYLLGSVYRLPGRPSMASAIGTAVHAGVEAIHKGHERPNDALVAAFGHELDQMTTMDESPATGLADAGLMLDTYRREVAPRFHPTLVEAPFLISVDGINVSGQIDAADQDVHDTKTRAGKTINGKRPSAFKAERHRFQLSLYGIAYRFLRGVYPARLVIDSLTRRGTYTEYVIDPAYGEVPDILGLASSGIMAEDFRPTGPANGSCLYCPYYQRECTYGVVD